MPIITPNIVKPVRSLLLHRVSADIIRTSTKATPRFRGRRDRVVGCGKPSFFIVPKKGAGKREEGRGSREQGAGSRGAGEQGSRGAGSREQGSRGAGSREQGAGSREEGRGKREEGRGKREQGAGSREEGRGNKESEKMSVVGVAPTLKKRCLARRALKGETFVRKVPIPRMGVVGFPAPLLPCSPAPLLPCSPAPCSLLPCSLLPAPCSLLMCSYTRENRRGTTRNLTGSGWKAE